MIPPPTLSWFFRYKLHHVVFWSVYHYLWWAWYEESTFRVFGTLSQPPYLIKYLSYVVVQLAGVYYILYKLVPRFLERHRYLAFLLTVCLIVVAMAIVTLAGYYVGEAVTGRDLYALYGLQVDSPWGIVKTQTLPSAVSATTLGLSIKLGRNWLRSQRHRELLEREKLETELKYLRSQFNPHFLFNTINSIFFLIDRNAPLASDSLAKFSRLLRYQLYECNSPLIPLPNELSYLRSFAELEELRQNDDFQLRLRLPAGEANGYEIAPFILMPFVENAFKHVKGSARDRPMAHIEIAVKNGTLHASFFNTCRPGPVSALPDHEESYGGLGRNNVERRLALLYPDRHRLHIDATHDTYRATLTLQLT